MIAMWFQYDLNDWKPWFKHTWNIIQRSCINMIWVKIKDGLSMLKVGGMI